MKVAPIENTLLAFLFNKKLPETQKGKDNELQGKCSFTDIFCDGVTFNSSLQHAFSLTILENFTHSYFFVTFKNLVISGARLSIALFRLFWIRTLKHHML